MLNIRQCEEVVATVFKVLNRVPTELVGARRVKKHVVVCTHYTFDEVAIAVSYSDNMSFAAKIEALWHCCTGTEVPGIMGGECRGAEYFLAFLKNTDTYLFNALHARLNNS